MRRDAESQAAISRIGRQASKHTRNIKKTRPNRNVAIVLPSRYQDSSMALILNISSSSSLICQPIPRVGVLTKRGLFVINEVVSERKDTGRDFPARIEKKGVEISRGIKVLFCKAGGSKVPQTYTHTHTHCMHASRSRSRSKSKPEIFRIRIPNPHSLSESQVHGASISQSSRITSHHIICKPNPTILAH